MECFSVFSAPFKNAVTNLSRYRQLFFRNKTYNLFEECFVEQVWIVVADVQHRQNHGCCQPVVVLDGLLDSEVLALKT